MLSKRRVLCGLTGLLALGCFTPVRAAFDDAFTLLPLLGPARLLGAGGPTLAELDPEGAVLNPAAVLGLKKKSLMMSLGKSGEGNNFSFFYALPQSGWSVGYQSLSLGDKFSTSDFGVGYAKPVAGRYPVGVRLHMLGESTPGSDRNGYGLDITSLLVNDDGFSYGVGFRNLLATTGAAGVEAPALFTAGVAWRPLGAKWSLKGGLTKNFQRAGDSFAQYTLGGEYRLSERISLLGGYQNKNVFTHSPDQALTFGVGYKTQRGLSLNYAAVLKDDTLGTFHRLDVATAFEGKSTVKTEAAPATVAQAQAPPFKPEPIRVALNVTETGGQRVAYISDETGSPIANQLAPFVSVRTWGPDKTKAGDTLELTVVFENLGKTEARHVQLFTNRPEGTDFLSQKAIGLDTEKVRFTDLGHKLLWELDTLPQGSYGELNLKLAVHEDFSLDALEFFSEAGYEDTAGQPYLSQESNITRVPVEKKEKEGPTKEKLLLSYKLLNDTLLVNTDDSAPFEDLTGHWAEKDIDFMKAAGLLSNLPGPFLYPDRPMDERRFYELLVLAQIYKRFLAPISLKMEVAAGSTVEVFLVPQASEEGIFLLDQKFEEKGEYTLSLERDFLDSFHLPAGDYDLVLQVKKGGGEPDMDMKPVKLLGSLVDLSPGFFEDKGLDYKDGLNKLVAVYGQGGMDATFLLTLADGTHTISRLQAAKAMLKSLGIQISEDDVAAFVARSPVKTPGLEESLNRLILTLAAQPITERTRKGLLDALSGQNPTGQDFVTRAQGIVMIYRLLQADPVDYRPMDVLAQLPLMLAGTAGGALYRLTAGHFISRDYAEDIAEYFKDYQGIEARVTREWVGSRHVYTVELARHLAKGAAFDLAKKYEKSRYPVHALVMAPAQPLRPATSDYALSAEQLEEIRQEKVQSSLPLALPETTNAERVNQPFIFMLDSGVERF